jgi:hypothetical protein
MEKNKCNAEGKREGYWEKYLFSKIVYKGNYINGFNVGYWEYFLDGNLDMKIYYIK